jgi:uncharacterized protein with HEPN domain
LKEEIIFVKHVLESIKNIESFSKNLSKKDFMKSRLKQSAIIRELEIIGETTKNISSNFRKKYPKVEWVKIAATRNKLIHHYFGISLNLVWSIIKKDLPILKKQIKEILEKEM